MRITLDLIGTTGYGCAWGVKRVARAGVARCHVIAAAEPDAAEVW